MNSFKMTGLFITLVFGLAFSINLISARPDAPMRREDGIHCHKDGLNANPDKSNQFLICAKNGGGKFMAASYSCSDGEEFDQNTMNCAKVLRRRQLMGIEPLCSSCSTKTSSSSSTTTTTEATTTTTSTTTSTTPEVTTTTKTSDIEGPPDCKNRTLHCLPDCRTLRLCYELGGAYKFLNDVLCNEGEYCDDSTASCTSKIPSTCPADFTCSGTGYFPDPSDCTKYYICYASGDELIASTQYCAANQVYSSAKKMCVAKIRLSDCHQVKCPAGAVQYTVFPGDPTYYVICMNGKPAYVFGCEEGKEFNSSTMSCEVTCKAAGRIADPDHCNQYYECTSNWLGNKFTLTSHTCPAGLGFNKATLLCDGETSCK